MLTAVTRFLSLVSATNHNLLPVRMLELPLGDGEALKLHVGDDLGGVQGGAQHLLDLSREQPGLGVCGGGLGRWRRCGAGGSTCRCSPSRGRGSSG